MEAEQAKLLDEVKATGEAMRRQLFWTRMIAALLAVAVAALVVCLGGVMRTMGQASQALQAADLAALADTMSRLDVDALNEAVGALEGKIDQLDVQAFSQAARNLNDAVQALQNAAAAIQQWKENITSGLTGLLGG